MGEAADAIRSAVPKRQQRQDALLNQLRDLHIVAAHIGMYDACDWLWKHVASSDDFDGPT